MSKRRGKCDCPMTWALAAGVIAGGLSGFALGWSWDQRPGALASVRLLDLLTAVGTVGATIAAVVIPLHQNADRRREKQLELAWADWAISGEVQLLAKEALDAANVLLESGWSVPLVTTQYLSSQLQDAKREVADSLGSMVINGLLKLTAVIQQQSEWRRKRMEAIAAGSVQTMMPPLTVPVIAELQAAVGLQDRANLWRANSLARYEQLGEAPPNVIKGGGAAGIESKFQGDAAVTR